MLAFELYFNPRAKKDVIYDSFIYEPETPREKMLGNLYVVGELVNALPQNSQLLNNLAKIIKEEYYAVRLDSPKIKLNVEQGLKKGLKKANEFLADEIKKGNVGWLGNLNFAILGFKDFVLNFTKTGALKILLLRAADGFEIIDIGSNLEFQDVASASKIFGNIVCGKLAPNDKIMVLSKDVFELFKKEDLIRELTVVSEEKEFKKFLKTKRDLLKEVSGICLLMFLTQAQYVVKKPTREYFQTLTLRRENWKYCISRINVFRNKISLLFSRIKKPLPLPSLRLNKVKNSLILIIILVLVLLVGFFIFRGKERQKLELIRMTLEETRQKVTQAENALIFKDEARANFLFQGAWQIIAPLSEEKSSFQKEIQSLMREIEEKLFAFNKLENIKEPQLAPDQKIFEKKSPQTDFRFDAFSTFMSYTYFLDNATGEILKCSAPLIKENCKPWLKSKTEKIVGAKSMAVDGNIWLLTKDNKIDRYYAGQEQETLTLNFFPFLEEPFKIWTSASIPYLYILEPVKNRVVIIDKTGKVVKQFQGEKFDNLKNFEISEDGKIVYVLNGQEVYQIIFLF